MSASLDIGVYGARGIPSTYSGYETFLTVLLPELARRGHRVTMYCRKGLADQEPTFEGVEKRFLPSVPTKSLDTLSHGAISAGAARWRGHDVVLVVNVANAAFCFLSRWTGQPVVLNTDGQEWLRGKWGPVGRRVFHGSARMARHGATALVADSAAMASIYATDFNAASTVIPYCWTGLSEADDPDVCARLGVTRRAYGCIAGRLVPENNTVAVAEAYAASTLPWPLLVLGAANYRSPVLDALRSLAARDSRIRVVGHLSSRDEFATVVRNAGVYLHAHSVGGINPSLLEAMGLGALIYALDTPFNREAVGSTGRLFSSFQPDLVGLLDDLAADGGITGESSRVAAAARAREVFAIGPVVDAYESLLRAASGAPRTSPVAITTPWAFEVPGHEHSALTHG